MPTNRYGNKKPTKDGQSREMRQRMAAGRRNRGETGMRSAPSQGRQVTTNYTTQNVNTLQNLGRQAMSLMSRLGIVGTVFQPAPAGNRQSLTSQGMYEGGEKAGPVDTKDQYKAVQRMQRDSFDMAFSRARREGKREFSWQGQRYNTDLA